MFGNVGRSPFNMYVFFGMKVEGDAQPSQLPRFA